MGRPEDGRQNIPLNAPAGGGGPGRFRIPQPLDATQLPGGERFGSSLDSMRFTRTIIEVEVATISPWTGPLMIGAELYYRKNLNALQEAVDRAIRYAPAAIEAETGQAIKEVVGSILDTLIVSTVIVGATSALGATTGGVIGFFLGGAGALPGAAAGAEAGFDMGIYLLEWMGLAFLLKHVAGNLGEIASLIGPNVKLAWEAADNTSLQRGILIDSAARGLAQAIAKLFRLILEAIVLFLLAKGSAKLGELTGKLKASKLGKGFGEWVERNWQKLVDDPRFNPRLRPKPKPQATGGGSVTERGAPVEKPSPKQASSPAEPEPSVPQRPYVNNNPKATPDEQRVGAMLDQRAKSGQLPGVKEVQGVPESNVRRGDYKFINDDNSVTSADLYQPESGNLRSIGSNTMGKSGQAETVIVELGKDKSGGISDADATQMAKSVVQTPGHSIKRVIVTRTDGSIITDQP